MSRLLFVFVSFMMLAYPFGSYAESENKLFYDAVRAEAEEDFDSAIRFYEESAKISHSANLYGNLANLYFKEETYGRAILNYRKALLLDPKNRELKANLSFVQEIARIESSAINKQNSYFSSSSMDAWTIFTTFVFWVGLGGMTLFFFLQVNRIFQVIFFLIWICLNSLGVWAVTQTRDNHDLQNREVIAIAPTTGEDSNASKAIYLRVSAFEGSISNTSVVPGESLFLEMEKNNSVKKHTNSIGETWYFARSLGGRNRGWVRQDQLLQIVPATER